MDVILDDDRAEAEILAWGQRFACVADGFQARLNVVDYLDLPILLKLVLCPPIINVNGRNGWA